MFSAVAPWIEFFVNLSLRGATAGYSTPALHFYDDRRNFSQGSGFYDEVGSFYAERSISGWNINLGVPYIEDIGGGEPFVARAFAGFLYDGFDHANPRHSCTTEDILIPNCQTGSCTYWADPYYVPRMRLYMPDGSSHELRRSDQAGLYSFGGVFYAVDGSKIRYEPESQTVYMPDGSRYLNVISGQNSQVSDYIDADGNKLRYDNATGQITDTLGRSITNWPSNILAQGDYNWVLPASNGNSLTYTFRWRYLKNEQTGETALTNPADTLKFAASSYWDGMSQIYQPLGSLSELLFFNSDTVLVQVGQARFNPIVLHEIVLPNGQKYRLTYNVYGEVDKVALPTGGYKFSRYKFIPPSNHTPISNDYNQANRGVYEMEESETDPGSNIGHWQFDGLPTQNYAKYTVKTIAPDLSYSERDIFTSSLVSKWGFDGFGQDVLIGKAYEERSYSSSMQLLRRTFYKWDKTNAPTPPASVPRFSPVSIPEASRNPRLVKQVEIMLDPVAGNNAVAKTMEYGYDADLNPILTKYYDYVTIDKTLAASASLTVDHASLSGGTLLRAEETKYLVNDTTYQDQATRDKYRARNLLGLPTISTTKDGAGNIVAETRYIYDEPAYQLANYPETPVSWVNPTDPDGKQYRGNVTTVRHWLNSPDGNTVNVYPGGAWLETHTKYDQYGNVRYSIDAKGNVAETRYDDDFVNGTPSGKTYAYPTQTLSPIPGGTGATTELKSYSKYDFKTGKIVEAKDENDQVTKYFYEGAGKLDRLVRVERPDSIVVGGVTHKGETLYEYGDTPGNLYVRTRVKQDNNYYLEDYVYSDGLDRVLRSSTLSPDETGFFSLWSVKETLYDNQGRIKCVSNPYFAPASDPTRPSNNQCSAGWLWTTTTYDDLDRVTEVTTPDGAKIKTAYANNRVTVEDQTNKKRSSVTDGLGRLVQVFEDPNGVNHQTDYSYDALGNLIRIRQGGFSHGGSNSTVQYRRFFYDSLSRLLRANNPEQDVNPQLGLSGAGAPSGLQWTYKMRIKGRGANPTDVVKLG